MIDVLLALLVGSTSPVPALSPAREHAPLARPASAPSIEGVLSAAVIGARRGWSEREIASVAQAIHDSGLDPALVLGLISTESSFARRARSPRGARGLLQLMPRTAAAYAARAGVPWVGPETLADPAANVRIGTTYLRALLQRFDGDLELALAAYSHGPTRVRRALAQRGALSARALTYGRVVIARRERFAGALAAWGPADPGGEARPGATARAVLPDGAGVRAEEPAVVRPAGAAQVDGDRRGASRSLERAGVLADARGAVARALPPAITGGAPALQLRARARSRGATAVAARRRGALTAA